MHTTHTVTNQAPPLFTESPYPLAQYPPLVDAVSAGGAEWALPQLQDLGELASSEQVQEWAWRAERHPPQLHTHDRYGHRIDEVEFDPAWHQLMSAAVEAGIHAAPWAQSQPGAHLARAAKLFVWSATDPGHICPISMTNAIVPALRHHQELAAVYEPLLTSSEYDPRLLPPTEKPGLIAGMSMTEKQGGSDVRANTTTATVTADGSFRLIGHKWFTSAPMSDLFLALAYTDAGLSCFLVPRVLPDGSRNAILLQRLKDKLGNRSNASAEIEYDQAVGWLVGAEGDGVRTIVEMVNLTRLDCAVGSAASMHLGSLQATHYARHRHAFGKPLIEQPLMANVLADLALEAEAATYASLRVAAAVDAAIGGDAEAAAFRRVALAVSKYWICKRSPEHAAEALECLGGNGYIETFPMARLYREAPVMSVWEGSGNVAALDALRAIAREPKGLDLFFAEVEQSLGADQHFDAAFAATRAAFADVEQVEFRARALAEQLALLLQGSQMLRHAPSAVAEAFCRSRFGQQWGVAFGTLPAGVDTAAILERVGPPR